MNTSHRKFVVFSSLVGLLTLTGALLLVLQPAPLTAIASSSLFAIDAPQTLDQIFDVEAEVQPGRWKYIYVHHSRTISGNALTLGATPGGLGDHFVIGNGDGAIDGEIQIGQRWNQQQAAADPIGARINHNNECISICLIGDFDMTSPTPVQVRRLEQLVATLQSRLRIREDDVLMLQADAPAGIGRFFPVAAFREQLLP